VHFSLPADWRRFDLSALDDPRLLEGDGSRELRSAGSSERLLIVSRVVGGRTLFQVGRSTQLRDELLGRFRRVAVALWGGASILALLVGRIAAQLTLRPLRELGATIRRLGEGSATRTRVPVRRVHDELDELGIHVNRLLDRIDALVTGMRQALDAVAHDLRTPVTRLRAGAERALDTASAVADYREALAVCIEESDRLISLLDALMDLAEAESGSMAIRRDPVDLRSIAHDAAELYTPMAEEKGVRVGFTAGPPAMVVGDRNRLAQAIANLIDNAVKYTPPGGRVDLDVRIVAEHAILSIADTGPGIPPHDLPRIWERLYRGDHSRSARGLGLGLSLVKAIVEAHGGRVSAESQPGSGSRFEMALPRRVDDSRS
jgi:signal transduction histidine kinase